MKYDPLKAARLVSFFKQAQGRLKQLARLSFAEFTADPDKVASAKYNFIVAIEAAIDLCNHLIIQNDLRLPEDYSDTFRVLGEAKVFPPPSVDSLTQMARFRNRLVHLYWDVDDEVLYSILQGRLADLDSLLASLGKALRLEKD